MTFLKRLNVYLDLADGFSLIFGIDLREAKDSLVQFGIVSWEQDLKKNPEEEEINSKNMAPMICECFEGLRYYLGDKERVSLPKPKDYFSIYLSGFIQDPGYLLSIIIKEEKEFTIVGRLMTTGKNGEHVFKLNENDTPNRIKKMPITTATLNLNISEDKKVKGRLDLELGSYIELYENGDMKEFKQTNIKIDFLCKIQE
ncbi:hypothetical protein [Phaeodactylibacter xiamenensis]|uniref:hypothetical protein n=1 Tax=Phaeodactylibacter xiamenensis TaxID=1524460 RepID=UPI003BA928B8